MFWSNSDCHLQLYCGLTAFWAFFFHQGMLLAIISSNKEVAAVNSSEKESRHLMKYLLFLVWFEGVLKMLNFDKAWYTG